MTPRRTALVATLALAGLALTADRASAQYYNYNYAVTPYGGYYNQTVVNPGYSFGYNPYVGFGTFNAAPTYAYQYGYYSAPAYPAYGVISPPGYTSYLNTFGPRLGLGYRGYRW